MSYRKEHTKGSKAIKPKREWNVHPRRARALGFHPDLSVREAKTLERHLNQKLRAKHWEERRGEEDVTRKTFNLRNKYAFPTTFIREFEKKFIRSSFVSSNYQKSLISGWTVAKKVIIEVDPDPSRWRENAHLFYEYFSARAWSLSYIRRIMRLTNLWGYFLCRNLGWSFLDIPAPRGHFRGQIYKAYFARLGSASKASSPLTPDTLETARNGLRPSH